LFHSSRIPQLKSERGANLEQRRHSTVDFKVFFGAGSQLYLLTVVRRALTAAAFSEAERIVFAAEGLFLAHGFPFYCGIRVHHDQIYQPVRRSSFR
jgi:hypothetical protein